MNTVYRPYQQVHERAVRRKPFLCVILNFLRILNLYNAVEYTSHVSAGNEYFKQNFNMVDGIDSIYFWKLFVKCYYLYSIQHAIKGRLSLGNTCYLSVQNL